MSIPDVTKGGGDAAGNNGCSGRRRRPEQSDNDDDDEDTLHHRHRRKPPQPPATATMTSTVTSESQSLASPPNLKQLQPQEPPQSQLQTQQSQLQHQRQPQIQNQLQQQPISSLMANVNASEPSNLDAEKNKKLLEWELSTLEANDLRSHAWYHGECVGRVEAERLLRKCVAEEHGIRITTITKTKNTNNVNINQMTENTNIVTDFTASGIAQNINISREEENTDGDSDSDNGLEDVSSLSSDGDFAMDDYLDELIDDDGRVPDPSTATSTLMATALLVNQRRRMNGVLPVKRPKRQAKQHKHFYCFLVRASVNVKPPGRFVVSCLRVDKYDDVDDKRKNGEDERSQKKRLRKQLKRRQLRQQRHPVLHFVINEIILQPGTVYERSQFTFGDSLPTVASFATMSYNVGPYNQRPNQPGFDSVPDLIRYYVGSAGDDAVLSYGGGNEGNSTIFPQTPPTEVRIRYPCNRRNPLTSEIPSLASALKAEERTRLVHQHSHALAMAAALAKTLPVPNACTIVPVEPKFPPQQPSNWTHGQSSFKASHRRTPSATVTSATITSIPSSAAGSANLDLQLDKSLPGPSKIISNLLDTEFTSSLNRSSSTLPRPLTSSSPRPPLIPESFSSSLSHSSATLPRPSASTSLSSSSTSGSSSNSEILKMALLPSTSSTLVTKLKITPNVSASESLLSSSFSSSSRFTPLTNVTNNKQYSQIELPPSEPSTSAGFSSQGTSGSSKLHNILTTNNSRGTGIIDIDAEIAAALDAENRSDDDEIDFYITEPPVVRSSFARVDLVNSHKNRSSSCHSRSESSWSRSGNRSSTFIPVVERDGHYQAPELIEPRDDQYQKLPLECAKQHQACYQSDKHNKRRQGEDDFGHSSDSKGLVTGEMPAKRTFESRMPRNKVLQKNVGQWTIQDLADSEIERMVRTGQIDPDEDSDLEEPPPIEEENFEQWRARWTTSVINRTSGTPEQQYVERLNRRRTRLIGQHMRSLKKGHEMQLKPVQIENFKESVKVDSKISPVTETTQSTEFVVPSTIQHTTTTSETQTLSSSARTSNDVIVETMISRWVGIDSQDPNPENSTRSSNNVNEPNQNFHLDILHRRRRRRIERHSVQEDHSSPTGDNTPPVKDYPLPAEKHYFNLPQLNQKMIQNQLLDLQANAADVTINSQSKTTTVVESIPSNQTIALSSSEVINNSAGHGSIECNLVCDYENIGISLDHHNINKQTFDQNSVNSFENFQLKNKVGYSVINSVDYENIIPRNANNSKCKENYENIKTEGEEQRDLEIRQKLIHENSGCSAAVASALLAVHLAIIGDPEDVNGPISVAGTGKLAAALCRADGRTTVLPYRRQKKGNEREGISIGPNYNTCPLQVLGHPGPQGRRARLDVIERFACLQYLVEMTVIVTPCLLLIGDNSRDPVDPAEKQIEWTLEDEYEYRRRLFYYQCAGIGSWFLSGENSNSDDEDNELTSNLDSRNPLPTKEEWAAEKRHWLDLLTKHRAAALDKWIRTAADAKQAVGDVYGYRALMTALCSDRIQTLRDAWATLRRIHTTTAVAFESRLRPEFLGRRDHQITGMVNEAHDLNNDDIDALLQLPPNATVPDPTALAVLYEHLYDEDSDSDDRNPSNSSNDIEESTSMFTSPLLISPSLWPTSNSGIGTLSGGLGISVPADYGLRALHHLCVQYSKWIQSYNNESSIHSSKSPMLQLERFRRNFQTLLHQYNDGNGHDDDEDDYDDGFNQKNRYEKNVSHQGEPDYSRDDEFVYERNYENKMEEFGSSGVDYDYDYGDEEDDDDDATVICCSTGTNSAPAKTTKENRHHSWIKAAIAHGRGPAPLDIVFRTELHVQLFWPPTLLLDDRYDKNGQNISDNHQLVVPAYALGTTYTATAAASHYCTNKSNNEDGRFTKSALKLEQIINLQLDRAARDMHLRYKIMNDFLDKACSFSALASKIANSSIKDEHEQCL